MADVRQKTCLYHDLHFPGDYRALQGGPSWGQGHKAAFGSVRRGGYDFLAEYAELHEDTVTPVFR